MNDELKLAIERVEHAVKYGTHPDLYAPEAFFLLALAMEEGTLCYRRTRLWCAALGKIHAQIEQQIEDEKVAEELFWQQNAHPYGR